MQHRRHADRLADLAEAIAGLFECLRRQQAVFSRGMRRATGLDDQDIVLDQLAHQVGDAFVLGHAGIIAAYYSHGTLDLAVHDVVVQRPERSTIAPAQHVVDVFMGEAGYHVTGVLRDGDLATVDVVIDTHPDDVLGDVERPLFLELNVSGARDLRLGGGGDQFGVELLRQRLQGLHDALHVDDHGIDGAGDDRQLLVQEVARRRNAMAL